MRHQPRATRGAAARRRRRSRAPPARTWPPPPARTPAARRCGPASRSTVDDVCASTKLRHCGIAEKLSNAVDPSSTASTRDGAGPHRQRRQVIERVADRDAAVGVAAQRRQPRRHHAVHLERVGARAPALTAPQRTGERHRQIDQQPNPNGAKRSRVGAGQFQPHEREQAEHRGPVPQRFGIGAGQRPAGRAAGAPCAPARSPATPARTPVTAPPGRPTAARRTHRAADCSHPAGRRTRPAPTHTANSSAAIADRPARDRRVDHRGDPRGSGTARLVRVEPRPPPSQRDDREGERQRPRRADQRIGVRDRQIGRAAEAVGQNGDGPIGAHCTCDGGDGLVQLVQLDVDLPGTSTVNWNVWPAWPRP